jgi:hypothetical protein
LTICWATVKAVNPWRKKRRLEKNFILTELLGTST